MTKKRSPFDILGVRPSDDMQAIRYAWRQKVRKLHPDLSADPDRATQQLAEVNAAFDKLQGHKPVKSLADLHREALQRKRRKAEAAQRKAEEDRLERLRAEVRAQRAAAEAARIAREAARKADALRRLAREKSAMAAANAPANSQFRRAATAYAAARKAIAVK